MWYKKSKNILIGFLFKKIGLSVHTPIQNCRVVKKVNKRHYLLKNSKFRFTWAKM